MELLRRYLAEGGRVLIGLEPLTDSGLADLLREFGIAQRDDLADVDQRISDLEHRIRLLEERPAG